MTQTSPKTSIGAWMPKLCEYTPWKCKENAFESRMLTRLEVES